MKTVFAAKFVHIMYSNNLTNGMKYYSIRCSGTIFIACCIIQYLTIVEWPELGPHTMDKYAMSTIQSDQTTYLFSDSGMQSFKMTPNNEKLKSTSHCGS